jgi:hypothetical protein
VAKRPSDGASLGVDAPTLCPLRPGHSLIPGSARHGAPTDTPPDTPTDTPPDTPGGFEAFASSGSRLVFPCRCRSQISSFDGLPVRSAGRGAHRLHRVGLVGGAFGELRGPEDEGWPVPPPDARAAGGLVSGEMGQVMLGQLGAKCRWGKRASSGEQVDATLVRRWPPAPRVRPC